MTAGRGGEIFQQSTTRVSGTCLALRSLLLLLALSSWSSVATAAPLVQTGEDAGGELRTRDASYAAEGLRSTGGINLLGSIDSHRPTGTGAPFGHGGATGGKLQPRDRPALFRAHGSACSGPAVRGTDAAIAPLCERLPYFATAPPSSR